MEYMHPRKEQAGSHFSNDTVSGSSAITNLADTVMSIEKPNIRVTKNRDFGTTGVIQCSYDPCNRRIFETAVGDKTVYGWNHEGITEPEEHAYDYSQFQISVGAEITNGDYKF